MGSEALRLSPLDRSSVEVPGIGEDHRVPVNVGKPQESGLLLGSAKVGKDRSRMVPRRARRRGARTERIRLVSELSSYLWVFDLNPNTWVVSISLWKAIG